VSSSPASTVQAKNIVIFLTILTISIKKSVKIMELIFNTISKYVLTYKAHPTNNSNFDPQKPDVSLNI